MEHHAVGDDDRVSVGPFVQVFECARRELDRQTPVDHRSAVVGRNGFAARVDDHDNLGSPQPARAASEEPRPLGKVPVGIAPAVIRICLAVAFVRRRSRRCGGLVGLTLKVILETGELREDAWIERAARLALDEGANFLKTSTGKTAVSATPRAAELMLQTIAQHPQACNRTGFKASGGIRSVAEAEVYMDCVEALLGRAALSPKRFRLGASALLTDVLAVLAGSALPSHGPEGY